jgi:subtilisin-like proprotein convertase family protein
MSLSDTEVSISIYHEILEAVTVAHDSPPESLSILNEAGFEQAAQDAHQKYGFATPSSVIEFLKNYEFNE